MRPSSNHTTAEKSGEGAASTRRSGAPAASVPRRICLGTAAALLAAALLPPISTLSAGVLFSAHMLQHLILLLIVPALWLLSRPAADVDALHVAESGRREAELIIPSHNPPAPGPRTRSFLVAGGWIGGVGSMWFWHTPQLCDAAAALPTVHWIQVISLLALGTAFWCPILSSNPGARISPAGGIAYLFTACLACTALGIILTLAPIEVCPIFRAPTAAYRIFTADEDRQIGGLIMWLPMCLIYLSAIFLELSRWLSPKSVTS